MKNRLFIGSVIFLLLVSIGIKLYASPVKIIPVETTGLSMVFTVSENKKVIFRVAKQFKFKADGVGEE